MTIHRRATTWTHGEVPENLLNMAREYGPAALSWNCLARSGRTGYKHVGLEIEVVPGDSLDTPEDVAGALLTLMFEHAATSGVEFYRIDAYDEKGDRLGDIVLRMGESGGADEVDTSSGAASRWALKALDSTHKQHMETLKVIPQLVEMVGQCLEAMGGAVASAAEARMSYANNEAEQQAEQNRHEKQMRVMELLAAHMSADAKGSGPRSSLADLLATMPVDVKDTLKRILGPLFDEMVAAVAQQDPEIRQAQVGAVLERITPAQKLAMGTEIPEEWRTQLLAAWHAELRGPQ